MTWYTVDGGGSTFLTGNSYELGGTTGQPDAGKIEQRPANEFVLGGGFWAAEQGPGCSGDANGDGVVNGGRPARAARRLWFGGHPRQRGGLQPRRCGKRGRPVRAAGQLRVPALSNPRAFSAKQLLRNWPAVLPFGSVIIRSLGATRSRFPGGACGILGLVALVGGPDGARRRRFVVRRRDRRGRGARPDQQVFPEGVRCLGSPRRLNRKQSSMRGRAPSGR